MPLQEYRAQRNFDETREPSGKDRGQRLPTEPIFVIQEHHASHLHYDFRLESDGVLKSWAVPKEPTLDPTVKRLAIQVEDHPLDYATFEGTIPRGQYGAGTVTIWDHGTFESPSGQEPALPSVSEAIDAGHIEFVLHGKKLQGKFVLIRMKDRAKARPQWLLIKMKDEFAQASPSNPGAHSRGRTQPKLPQEAPKASTST